MRHGQAPSAPAVDDDPWLGNVNADMNAWLLLEAAGLDEDPEQEDA